MATYVRRNGVVIPKEQAGEDRVPWVTGVISDNMAPLKHHGTGRVIDSKAKFRADTRACGAVEIGNEAPRARKAIPLDRGQRREAIRKSFYEARNGR